MDERAYVVVLGEYSDRTPVAAFADLEDARRFARRQRSAGGKWVDALSVEVVPMNPTGDATLNEGEVPYFYFAREENDLVPAKYY